MSTPLVIVRGAGSALVLTQDEGGALPHVVHWGTDLPDAVLGDLDEDVKVAIRPAVFSRRSLAFQANTLPVADAGGDFHIQGLRRFAFDHSEDVIDRQFVADGTRLLGQRLLKEHRDFNF